MRVALGQIHRALPPFLGMRRRGMGQSGCPYGGLTAQLQNFISSLSDEPATVAAVGCGTGGGAPCPDPVTAAEQQVNAIAADYCNIAAEDAAEFNCPVDPDCTTNLTAVVNAAIAQAQAIFEQYPSSVWQAEASAASSGQYYNEVPTCPPNTSPSQSGGVVTCYSLTTGAAEQPSYAPAPVLNSPTGPSLNIQAGVPSSTSPAAASSYAAPSIPAPASIAQNNAATVGTTLSAGTPGATAPITATVAPATAAAATSGTTSSPFAFLTESAIGGIPNWALIAGGLALVLALPSLMGGRR
jgi:hypothetical protein